jgi:hypothetical protein
MVKGLGKEAGMWCREEGKESGEGETKREGEGEEVVQWKRHLQRNVSVHICGSIVDPIVKGRRTKMVKGLGHEAVMQ